MKRSILFASALAACLSVLSLGASAATSAPEPALSPQSTTSASAAPALRMVADTGETLVLRMPVRTWGESVDVALAPVSETDLAPASATRAPLRMPAAQRGPSDMAHPIASAGRIPIDSAG